MKSLLETDLYKFTMLQVFQSIAPGFDARYVFKCRNANEVNWADLLPAINDRLDQMCSLSFTTEELSYLANLRYMKKPFIQFLRHYKLEREFIKAWVDDQGTLHVEAKGPLLYVMMFEIYVLSAVNEVYFAEMQSRHPEIDWKQIGDDRLTKKIEMINDYVSTQPKGTLPFELLDFGLRRRFSAEHHEHVVTRLKNECPAFRGTSNVYLAMKHGLIPMGTHAHEYFQVHQAMPDCQLRAFQKKALENWVQFYRGDLGIALTDIIGMKQFLQDFDLFYAKLFDGLRHDSGDAIQWGEQAIAHYQGLKIDPKTKRLVFSDGLTVESALGLHEHFRDRIQMGFGIGTSLSNDVGFKPLNIVMKIVECNGQPVAKLSDSPGKNMCEDPSFVAYLAKVFDKTL